MFLFLNEFQALYKGSNAYLIVEPRKSHNLYGYTFYAGRAFQDLSRDKVRIAAEIAETYNHNVKKEAKKFPPDYEVGQLSLNNHFWKSDRWFLVCTGRHLVH